MAVSWFLMNCLRLKWQTQQLLPVLQPGCLDTNDRIWDFAIFDIICLPFVSIFLETSGGQLVHRSLLTSEEGKSLDLVSIKALQIYSST